MRACYLVSMLIPLALAFGVSCGGTAGKNTCTSDDDCFGGGGIEYGCDTVITKICLRKCSAATEATDCLASQYCDVAAGSTEGLCRSGTAPSGDSETGDPGSAGD